MHPWLIRPYHTGKQQTCISLKEILFDVSFTDVYHDVTQETDMEAPRT